MARNEVRGIFLALAAGLACSSGSRLPNTSGPVALEVGGDVEGGPFRLGEADLAALPQGELHGVDPRTGQLALYQGLSIAALGERVELEKGADTVVVRSAEGAAIPIPLSVVRQHRPVLAARVDGGAADARMLAWPNVRHHGLTSDPRAPSWWVRRVVRIDFVAWHLVYGRAIRIPEGAPRGALAGARTFAARCIGCHEIRGVGGANGPGLAKGGPFTDPKRLTELLAGHPGASTPNVGPLAPERVEELATFLKLISVVPAEDDGGEAP